MKKSRFTDSQIIDPIKRMEAGLPVSELSRELSISTALFDRWRAKFDGMDAFLSWRARKSWKKKTGG